MEKLKLIVVDDHTFFRIGVILTVNRLKYADVIAEASNGCELIDLLSTQKPDLILTDIKMPIMDGIDATREIKKRYPEIKIVALSMFMEEEYLEKMIDAGVDGFLLKNCEVEDLNKALIAVSQGKQYFSEEFLPFFTNKYLKKRNKPSGVKLTNREKEILSLIARGLTNIEIAESLFISVRTVTSHRANINTKIGAKNTVSLLSYALKHNLVEM